MKQPIKKLTSAALALAMGVSMAGNVFANEIEETEYVQIAGYTCTVEDGQYYTEIDGERCQVINLNDYIPEVTTVSADEYANEEDNNSLPGAKASGPLLYSDTVNVERDGDYRSPLIKCKPTVNFIIKIQDSLNGRVSLEMLLYGPVNDSSIGAIEKYTYHFNLFVTENKLVISTEEVALLTERCQVLIFKEGTTISPLSYALYNY